MCRCRPAVANASRRHFPSIYGRTALGLGVPPSSDFPVVLPFGLEVGKVGSASPCPVGRKVTRVSRKAGTSTGTGRGTDGWSIQSCIQSLKRTGLDRARTCSVINGRSISDAGIASEIARTRFVPITEIQRTHANEPRTSNRPTRTGPMRCRPDAVPTPEPDPLDRHALVIYKPYAEMTIGELAFTIDEYDQAQSLSDRNRQILQGLIDEIVRR